MKNINFLVSQFGSFLFDSIEKIYLQFPIFFHSTVSKKKEEYSIYFDWIISRWIEKKKIKLYDLTIYSNTCNTLQVVPLFFFLNTFNSSLAIDWYLSSTILQCPPSYFQDLQGVSPPRNINNKSSVSKTWKIPCNFSLFLVIYFWISKVQFLARLMCVCCIQQKKMKRR